MGIENRKIEVEIPAVLTFDYFDYEPAGEFRPPKHGDVYLVGPVNLARATFSHSEPCFIYSKIGQWRAEVNETFYYIEYDLTITEVRDCYNVSDNQCYELGNYFKTVKEAEKALNKLRQVYKELRK